MFKVNQLKMSEKFNLKWNDFHTNVSRSFEVFRNETYLHDVTLVSDDYKQISAHKLVLSACSEYFRNILQHCKQTQPLLCLEGVNSEDLQNVLDYVYLGEVKILQEDLDRFLHVAQRLKLDGLMSDDAVEEETQYDDQIVQDNNEEESMKMEKHREASYDSLPKTNNRSTGKKSLGLVQLNSSTLSEFKAVEQLDENILRNDDGTLSCRICGKTTSGADKKRKMRNHVETHMEGLSYSCTMCDKTFRSVNAFTTHKSRNHKRKNIVFSNEDIKS